MTSTTLRSTLRPSTFTNSIREPVSMLISEIIDDDDNSEAVEDISLYVNNINYYIDIINRTITACESEAAETETEKSLLNEIRTVLRGVRRVVPRTKNPSSSNNKSLLFLELTTTFGQSKNNIRILMRSYVSLMLSYHFSKLIKYIGSSVLQDEDIKQPDDHFVLSDESVKDIDVAFCLRILKTMDTDNDKYGVLSRLIWNLTTTMFKFIVSYTSILLSGGDVAVFKNTSRSFVEVAREEASKANAAVRSVKGCVCENGDDGPKCTCTCQSKNGKKVVVLKIDDMNFRIDNAFPSISQLVCSHNP
jgi:hypothetical protein